MSDAIAPPPPPGWLPTAARVRWGMGDWWWIFATAFGLAIVGFVAGITMANALHGRTLTDDEITTNAIVIGISSGLQFGAFVGGVLLVSRLKGTGRPQHDFGVRLSLRDAWAFPIGLVGQYALAAIILPITNLPGHSDQTVVENLRDASGPGLATLAVVAVILAPFAEEVLFRGLLLRSLLRRMGPAIAVAVCGIWFGLVHVALDPDALGSLPALSAVGVLAAVLAVRRGDLSASIWLHVGFNFPVVFLILL